jgi:hypothetical protein
MKIVLVALCLACAACGGGDPEDAGVSVFCDTSTPEGKVECEKRREAE